MQKSIYPCLWFDGNAKQAADFYCLLFKNAHPLQSNPIVTNLEIGGTKVMALNGGATYTLNSAVSYFIYCNGEEEEIDRLYNELTIGGQILMPLNKYEWSRKYAWVIDSFGVNWQLDIDPINNDQKLVPCLLFANEKNARVKEAADLYTSIFPNSSILLEAPFPETANIKEGTLLFAQFKLNGFIVNAMSSTLKHDFDFTPANSFVVECLDQQEIDYYWEKLGEGGRYSVCGWLEDKFGVSWQIVPKILGELMADPVRSPRVIQAFLKMKKFDIKTLLEA